MPEYLSPIQTAEEAVWAAEIREGISDKREDEMTTDSAAFWASRMPAPAGPSYDDAINGSLYRDSNRQRGLPGALSEQWINAHHGGNRGPIHRPELYNAAPPKQLGDYASQPVIHPQLPRDGESDTTFEARVRGSLNGLRAEAEVGKIDADTYNAIITAYNEAIARIDSGEARQGTRREGDGLGIFGDATTPRAGMTGAVSYRDLEGSRSEVMMARQQETRDSETERLTWLRNASRDGYEPVAGAAAATVRTTARQYAGNQGMFG